MTRDEIVRLARECGIGWAEGLGGMEDFLMDFAGKVAAAERLEGWRAAREGAAKLCEDTDVEQFTYCQVLHDDGPATLRSAAESIRAMQQPAEWGDMGIPISAPAADWPHPDGFAGGMMGG